MADTDKIALPTLSAAELRRMSPEQRDAILTEAAARAERDYRPDRHLADFEAFGEADLI